MKKILLLFFITLSLGLGHGTVSAMNIDMKMTDLTELEAILPKLSADQLCAGLTDLIVSKWSPSSRSKIQGIRTEINRRDPNKPYTITFNDPNILGALIKKAFSYKAPTI